MTFFQDYRTHTGSKEDKEYKATLFRSTRLLLGLNCLEPGQSQHAHRHPDQDKFYFVVEGEGEFTIGEEVRTVGAGVAVWAPFGTYHGVTNRGECRLVLLMGIAPAPPVPREAPHGERASKEG